MLSDYHTMPWCNYLTLLNLAVIMLPCFTLMWCALPYFTLFYLKLITLPYQYKWGISCHFSKTGDYFVLTVLLMTYPFIIQLPFSNLSVVSKMIEEKIITMQLTCYLEENFPSLNTYGFRIFHCSESLITHVIASFFIWAVDRDQVTLLAPFLNMSLAFDTIDSGVIVERLQALLGAKVTMITLCVECNNEIHIGCLIYVCNYG